MKTIVFDAGPIISLTMNNLLWILPELSKKFNVKYIIPTGVKKQIGDKAKSLMALANSIYRAKGHNLQLIQYGEMSAFAAAKIYGANAVVVDERITRALLEHPEDLAKLMSRRLHTRVHINKDKLKEFHKLAKGIKIIRSVELATIAYEKGILDAYKVNVPNNETELLSSILWGVKLHGCAVTETEIRNIIHLQKNLKTNTSKN